jgi:hypothetical protein
MFFYGIGVACLLVGAMLGFVGGHWRAVGGWRKDVRRLEAALVERDSELKKATLDSELVRALREREIGIDDLQGIGFDGVRQEATGMLSVPASDYLPFTPRSYSRNVSYIQNMTPGDEVWISLYRVYHRVDGIPVVMMETPCSPNLSREQRCRIRFVGGIHGREMAVDPEDSAYANGQPCPQAGYYVMDHVTVLRPEDRFRG